MLLPFGKIPPDQLIGLVGVVFDIDDTVTRDGRLEATAFSAMHELAHAGLRLIAITGRPLGWSDVVAHLWPVELAVGENGAGWAWRKGHALQAGYYQDNLQREASDRLLQQVRAAVRAAMPEVKPAGDQHLRRCDLAFDVGETVHLEAPEIERLVDVIEGAGARTTVSSVHAHAVPGDWNKATGVVRAARQALDLDLGGDRHRWLFIGDSGNDAAAFAHFPISVGVSNVRAHLPRIPSPPKYVTSADRGRGFREMADAILLHRRPHTDDS
jgi:HAD superfamily hydrolase (TIGR01484 family)